MEYPRKLNNAQPLNKNVEQIVLKNEDIIKMRVDLDNGYLKYFINDKCVACTQKTRNDTYMVGIYLFCRGTKIQLLQ